MLVVFCALVSLKAQTNSRTAISVVDIVAGVEQYLYVK